MQLRNAHVVIVGGSKGVGAALVRDLAGRGARVSILARDSENLRKLASDVGGNAVPVDLCDPDSIEGLIECIEAEHGAIDVLISNAAYTKSAPFRTVTAQELRTGVMTNFFSHVELIRQALPLMLARDHGTLAIIGSASTEVSMIHLAVYAPGKTALTKFGIDLQRELSDSTINVPVIVLGSVPETQMSQAAREDPVMFYIDEITAKAGVMTPEVAATGIMKVLQKDRSGLFSVPKTLAPLVQFRMLPQRLIDPVLVGPAVRKAREAWGAR
jgi:short-subunit dehydrogenase